MKALYPFSLLLVLSFSFLLPLSAQTVFNQGWAPKAGHVSQNLLATPPAGAIPGANQHWDFSGLSAAPGDIRFTFEYLDVASTPYANLFPEATIAAKVTFQGMGDQYSYYREDATGYYTLGSASPNATTIMEDIEKGLCYPLAYGDSYSDTYAFVSDAGGFQFRTEGTAINEYNGYGTLDLPQGTFSDVAHYSQYRTEKDSFGFAPGFYTIDVRLDTTIGWINATYPSPLALMQRLRSYTLDYQPGQTEPDTTNMLYEIFFTYDDSAEATPTSTQENSSITEKPLFPNPVSTTLHWQQEPLLHQAIDLQIINSIGQIFWSASASQEPLQQIPVDFLSPGQYWLKIQDRKNVDTRLLPFVKQ